MAKTRRHHRSRRHRQRGGDSAWQYVMKNFGDGQTQAQNSLMVQPGDNIVAKHNLTSSLISNPNSASGLYGLPKSLTGGSRKSRGGFIDPTVLSTAAVPVALLAAQQRFSKKRRGRGRKGGNVMEMLNTAAVPVALLAAQQRFSKKRRGRGRKSRL